MICFCGDSYAMNEGIATPNQWHKQLAKKIYGEKFMDSYINFALGGKCNDHIIENQLIGNVLSMYPHKPLEYLVIGFAYWERFKLSNAISWTPAEGIYGDVNGLKQINSSVFENNKLKLDTIGSDDEIKHFLNTSVRNSMILKEDTFARRKAMIVSLLDFIKRFGTKLFLYDNYSIPGTSSDTLFYNVDDYCKKISITSYTNTLNEKEYSNHFSIESNTIVAEAFYNEIINK
jgi:hypothetical protein